MKKANENAYMNQLYKVGDIYITTNSANPSTRFGGTWELFGPGRTMVCVDTSQTEFNSVKKTGGEKTHYHDVQLRLPMDYGDLLGERFEVGGDYGLYSFQQSKYNKSIIPEGNTGFKWNGGHTLSNSTPPEGVRTSTAVGDTSSSTSLQPFITCYVWVRIS